jgi:hypothetical protein
MQKRGRWCIIRAKALDPDPFPCRSLRHVVYAALLHFGLETAWNNLVERIMLAVDDLGSCDLLS